jgi:hypothetical protein
MWHQRCNSVSSKLSGFMQRKTAMNIKAIIASLVLGSSSVAMASPSVTVSATAQGSYDTAVRDHHIHDNCDTPVVIQPVDHRGGWRGERMPPVYRPVTLASGLHFASDGRTFITVGRELGRFEALQISGVGGRTFIKQIYVQFDNGQEQVVRNLDRMLTRDADVTIDLDGHRRAIRRIVVYGNSITSGWGHRAGSFTVTGS